MNARLVLTGFVLLAATMPGAASAETLRFKQATNTAPLQPLSPAELQELGDPFFNIVLKDNAEVTSLGELEALLQPDADKRRLFVVDENIANPSRPQSRRAVMAFKGANPATGEVLDANVMFSVFLTSERFPDQLEIEALGWDDSRGRYNYYKLDRRTPGGTPAWKFRGSSDGADLLSADERHGSCLECHVNGGPIMKELAFPWTNWHSFKFPASYMRLNWPVRTSPRMATLEGAEQLETEFLLGAIKQFNNRRIEQSLERGDDGSVVLDDDGNARVVDGPRLLKPLFATTEFNIITADELSGMHPFAPGEPGTPPTPIKVPDTFFLNANLIAGGGPTNYQGLGIRSARAFKAEAVIQPDEYRELLATSGVGLGGQPGDAVFAWMVPEPSHMDNSMVDALMRRGIVSPAFVAAVLAIDLETPVLSADRAALLRFVPETFPFTPRAPGDTGSGAAHPDALTTAVIANIRATDPADGTVEAEFLALLEDDDPVARLRERVDAYRQRVITRLQNPQTRDEELARLHARAVALRQEVKSHPVMGALDETGNRLFPLP